MKLFLKCFALLSLIVVANCKSDDDLDALVQLPGEISENHPRLLSESRISLLKEKVSNNHESWSQLKNVLDQFPEDNTAVGPFEYALAALASDNPDDSTAYAQEAFKKAQQVMNEGRLGEGSPGRGYGFDQFLYASDYTKDIGYVYDIFYNSISEEQRRIYQDYMIQVVDELWNDPNGWSLDNPYNNYYNGHMLTTVYMAMALLNDRDEAEDWLDFIINDRLEGSWPVIELFKGGHSSAGPYYGRRHYLLLTRVMMVLKEVGYTDLFTRDDYFKDLV